MRLTRYFLPTTKDNPQEAQIVSHRFMLRAGMMRQETSGIYSWLPLGLKVLHNVCEIIRKTHNDAGCVEVLMPTLQPADLWQKSGRYDAYGKEMLRIKDRHDRELVYSPTNEEMITDIFKSFAKSYRDVPKILYQMQWKFRDEIRPRFGVMRGREFYMKDAYSFDLTYEDAVKSYNLMFDTYLKTFAALGLKVIPVQADSGAIGGDLTHEFHVLAKTGESTLYYDEGFEKLFASGDVPTRAQLQDLYAVSDEKYEKEPCPIDASKVRTAKGIEVGHIFYFGTKYSEPLKTTIMSKEGKPVHPEMGSYGIGLSRLLGAIIEANHDDVGIIWPFEVTPFHFGIANLKMGEGGFDVEAETLYKMIQDMGYDVLYDDRDMGPGAKLADLDLIGLPYHIVLGAKSMAKGCAEIKDRRTHVRTEVPLAEVKAWIEKNVRSVK